VGLPDFIGIGGQRCGTSAIYRFLKAHPDVEMARNRKEVHYFDRYHDRGPEWYANQFPEDGELTGEITPDYLHIPECAARMANLLPDANLIVSIRNPIDRAFSQYKYVRMRDHFRGGFREFLDEYADAVSKGSYATHLERFLTYYPVDQLNVVVFERYVTDTQSVLKEIADFLGLEPREDWPPDSVPEGGSTTPRFPRLYSAGKTLTRFLHDRNLSQVVDWMKTAGLKQVLKGTSETPEVPQPSEAVVDQLREIYRNELDLLSDLSECDVDDVWGINSEPKHESEGGTQ
jgi:hypothetical protein